MNRDFHRRLTRIEQATNPGGTLYDVSSWPIPDDILKNLDLFQAAPDPATAPKPDQIMTDVEWEAAYCVTESLH